MNDAAPAPKAPAANASVERRHEARTHLFWIDARDNRENVAVRIAIPEGEHAAADAIPAVICDLSHDGIRLLLQPGKAPAHRAFTMKIFVPAELEADLGHALSLPVERVWAKTTSRLSSELGCRFGPLDDQARAKLDRLLAHEERVEGQHRIACVLLPSPA